MNLNLLLIITAVILLCMVVDGYKKGMVRSLISLISLLITCVVLFLLGNALSSYFDGRFFNVIITHSVIAGSHRTGTPFTKCGIFLCKGNLKTTYST